MSSWCAQAIIRPSTTTSKLSKCLLIALYPTIWWARRISTMSCTVLASLRNWHSLWCTLDLSRSQTITAWTPISCPSIRCRSLARSRITKSNREGACRQLWSSRVKVLVVIKLLLLRLCSLSMVWRSKQKITLIRSRIRVILRCSDLIRTRHKCLRDSQCHPVSDLKAANLCQWAKASSSLLSISSRNSSCSNNRCSNTSSSSSSRISYLSRGSSSTVLSLRTSRSNSRITRKL